LETHLILQLILQKSQFLIALLVIKLGNSKLMVKTLVLTETSNFVFYVHGGPAPGYIFPQSVKRGRTLLPEGFPEALVRRGGSNLVFVLPDASPLLSMHMH
jgi:hypothetical protein